MTDDIPESMLRAAVAYDRSADELEAAVDHLRTAARHFRDAEVPRGCAHAFAAYGHMLNGQGLLDENARMHATKAQR